MSASRIWAAAISAVLAVSALAAVPPTPAAAAQEVPCPRVPPPTPPPATPPPPPVEQAERKVGGDALATSGLAIPAGAPMAPSVTATAWVVADVNSGEVLGGCAPHERRTPGHDGAGWPRDDGHGWPHPLRHRSMAVTVLSGPI